MTPIQNRKAALLLAILLAATLLVILGIKPKPFFRWYDLWIGAYIDVNNRAIYICPLPMVGVKLRRRK